MPPEINKKIDSGINDRLDGRMNRNSNEQDNNEYRGIAWINVANTV